jgi:uncharacterized protein (DUF2252 family)
MSSANVFRERRPSIAERRAAGKALRKSVPRRNHARYRPRPDRVDPIALLREQNATRVAKLIPIRHARMLASPFSFYRGGAALMAHDLANTPRTGIRVQACGDAHLANFGVFASAERNLVFSINDFDETIPGPWEWDLKRLAASIVLCCRYLGASRPVGEEAVRATVRSYAVHMQDYAETACLALCYETIDEEGLLAALPPKLRQATLARTLKKARRRTNLQVLEKMTEMLDNKRHIRESKPLLVRETHVETGRPVESVVVDLLADYVGSLRSDRRQLVTRYRVVDVARKVVGVGSVGTRCWVLFMEGDSAYDPLFLQIKQAQPSALAPFVDAPDYPNQGFRVIKGQRLIQGAPDILLGWGTVDGVDYYVRQLRDWKGSVRFEPDDWDSGRVLAYSAVCGWALALAHAKCGKAAMLAGYIGRGEALADAIAQFADAYADQAERDYDLMRSAAKQGRIAVWKEGGEPAT